MSSGRRRTKIIATLGPATDRPNVLAQLLEAGVDCARLNCSHSGPEELRARAEQVRQVALAAGRPLAMMFDLQGPKLRLSRNVEAGVLDRGAEVSFHGTSDRPVDEGSIEVDVEHITDLISEQSEVIIGDGSPRLDVVSVHQDRVTARVTSSGAYGPRKGIAVPHAAGVSDSVLTEKDMIDLAVAAEVGADYVALSFVRHADDISELRRLLREKGSRALVIAKIEKLEAVENLEEIARVADGILVARGDYGVEAGLAAVPLMQKRTIQVAAQNATLVITATQMLETMISSPIPTRAEASDVANAVLDGTSAVMLSAETAVGQYPVQAVEAMRDVIVAAEDHDVVYVAPVMEVQTRRDQAVMRSAVTLATEAGADAIIVPTDSGFSARACSRFRPRMPILALCRYQRVADQLSLEWGVEAHKYEGPEDLDELLESARAVGVATLGLQPGAKVVITGSSKGGKTTDLVTLLGIG